MLAVIPVEPPKPKRLVSVVRVNLLGSLNVHPLVNDGDNHQRRESTTCAETFIRMLEVLVPLRWKGKRNHCNVLAWRRAQGTMPMHDIIFPRSLERRMTGTVCSLRI